MRCRSALLSELQLLLARAGAAAATAKAQMTLTCRLLWQCMQADEGGSNLLVPVCLQLLVC